MPSISKRSEARLEALKRSPFPIPSGPLYDPILHPDGTINLSTAENSLLSKDLLPIFESARIKVQHLKYRSTLLRSSLTQLADLLPAYVNRRGPVRPVTRDNSVPGPGVGALLAQLVWNVCDAGEGVMLSTPYYHDYERDIAHPAGAATVLAHIPASVDSLSPAVIPYLRERVLTSEAEGVRVRALILCNPHNPIPQCYPVATIEAYISLARELDLHLIVDEVFAYSVFPTEAVPNPQPFISVLSLPAWSAASDMLQQIHVLAAPTKDLGCSAIKAAVLVTENTRIRRSIDTALNATPISGLTDAGLSEVLGDDARLSTLLDKNQAALSGAMNLCAEWATFHKLPFVPANAGVYFILDMSPLIPRLGLGHLPQLEGEAALMIRMIAQKVFINPTSLDADPMPYRFRTIFTHPTSTLKLALHRIELAFGLTQWPGLQWKIEGRW